MKAFPVAVLAGVFGVGMLVAIPDTPAAQREVPLAAENRMHPDSILAPHLSAQRAAQLVK